jgi:hypothetical protein
MTKNHLRILIVFLLLVGNGLLNSTIATQRIFITDNRGIIVYICKGPNSKRYHKESDCQGLRNCSTQIYAVDLSEAESLGRTPCGYCY